VSPIVYPTRCNVTQFILSGNCSTCFGWYLHPSSGAQTAVSTVSGICHTVMDRVKLLIQCTRRYKNTVWLQSSCTRHLNHTVIERPKVVKLKLQLLLIMYFCGKCSMFCLIMLDIHNVTATCRYRLRNMLSSFQIK